MNIENEIFKRGIFKIESLVPYGFIKDKNVYKYSKKFMNSFRADIVINEEGVVTGKVYDLNIDDEYTNFRIENHIGEFANKVREEYKNILKDIREHCFDNLYFITEQANRITKRIMESYHDEPEFLWEKFPGYGIFRNPVNEKWYGAILNIDKSKIDKKHTGEIEVINLKLDEEEIPSLLKKKGFYPGYHMNKKNWVTITLDDTLSDDEIMKYVSISHKYTETPNEWIVPANPNYYDVINCFNNKDIVEWKQSNDIKVGDMVYLYVGSPYSAILYKCEAIEVNIPYEYKDKNLAIKRVMKIKLLEMEGGI
ncbi:MAG: MmcQ/YjbR family DNA-binding protein [Bacilli bacterium]|nr:MmcQ/YjbR family DNA-binding protein [Bacilli bacterium]